MEAPSPATPGQAQPLGSPARDFTPWLAEPENLDLLGGTFEPVPTQLTTRS